MTQSNIDLDAFIDLLDGQVDEGNNGTFYLDKSGIRAIVPGVSERQSIGLFTAEKAALRQFEKDCRLRFPCTIDDVRQWIERTGEADMPDGLAEPIDETSQRAAIAAELANMDRGGDRGNQYTGGKGSNDPLANQLSIEQAAELMGVSAPTVKRGPQAAIPDEALDHYDQLRANGADWFNAATDTIAIERFNLDGINPDSIKRASNRRRRARD